MSSGKLSANWKAQDKSRRKNERKQILTIVNAQEFVAHLDTFRSWPGVWFHRVEFIFTPRKHCRI